MTYLDLIDKIESFEPFSFSRYGDGEFNCMFGKAGANCDGHEYFEDLGERLNHAFLNPRGIIAVQRYGYEQYKDQLGANVWADADILHRASIEGKLHMFHEALQGNEVVLVGPKHLREFRIYDEFIEVPLRNAWKDYFCILQQLKWTIGEGDIVLYCCGMMAEVLIWDMYKDYYTQIDCGSLFDPYVGVMSRQYHKTLDL